MIILAGLSLPTIVSAQSVDYGGYRPSYQGYGVNTPGGRGGVVYVVSTLADSGTGSLREALQASGPRFVVFAVSGRISLKTPIKITSPYVTVAGQTAPSPGITVTDVCIYIETHDVVLQHFALRIGDAVDTTLVGLYGWVAPNYNVVLDHMSISWAPASNVGILDHWDNYSMLDCIVSESLTGDTEIAGPGMLVTNYGDSPMKHITIARTLFAHNGNRNPWIGSGVQAAVLNNVAYDASGVGGDAGTWGFFIMIAAGGYLDTNTSVAYVGNVSLPGPSTPADNKTVKIRIDSGFTATYQVYLNDNTGPYMAVGNQYSGVTYQNTASSMNVTLTAPSWFSSAGYAVLPNAAVYDYVLAHAGKRPLDRDPIDARVVSEVKARTGGLVSTLASIGGFGTIPSNVRTLTVPANPNAVAPGQTFRTNIEVWLEGYAVALESLSAPQNLHIVR